MFANTIDTNNFYLLSPTAETVSAGVQFDALTNIASLTPAADLALSTRYFIRLDTSVADITDLSGNPLAFTSSSFTTREGAWTTNAPPIIDGTPTDNVASSLIKMDAAGNAVVVNNQGVGMNLPQFNGYF